MDDTRTAMLFCPPLPPQRVDALAPVAIGRHPSCEFSIRKSDVSRRHAEVHLEDGDPVDGDCPLEAGDKIEIETIRASVTELLLEACRQLDAQQAEGR